MTERPKLKDILPVLYKGFATWENGYIEKDAKAFTKDE